MTIQNYLLIRKDVTHQWGYKYIHRLVLWRFVLLQGGILKTRGRQSGILEGGTGDVGILEGDTGDVGILEA